MRSPGFVAALFDRTGQVDRDIALCISFRTGKAGQPRSRGISVNRTGASVACLWTGSCLLLCMFTRYSLALLTMIIGQFQVTLCDCTAELNCQIASMAINTLSNSRARISSCVASFVTRLIRVSGGSNSSWLSTAAGTAFQTGLVANDNLASHACVTR